MNMRVHSTIVMRVINRLEWLLSIKEMVHVA